MKFKRQKFVKNFILIALMLTSILLFTHRNNIIDMKHEEGTVKQSGDWNLSPFVIDDTGSGDYTWTQAALEDWCSGSGTLNNPYIIENVTIDGNKLSSCLTIQNSNVHFNIQYCNFKNSSFGSNGGILLINTSNGKIICNNLTNNPSGIRLEWCNNIFIEDNNILDSNDNGVIVWNGNYIQIIENFVNFSSYGGINLIHSNYSSLKNNTVQYCSVYGIYIGKSSHNKIISNKISNLSLGVGINVDDSSLNNSFSLNTLMMNYYGVSIANINSEQNLLFKNYFINNTQHASDNGFNNHWNNTLIGNYWEDYGGIDADDDMIGDTPYYISGAANSNDSLPIWDDGDDIDPQISISYPTNYSIIGVKSPSFQVSIIEAYLYSSWYFLNGTVYEFFTGESGTINQALWDSFANGNITITFWANDSRGHTDSAYVVVRKNLLFPSIEIIKPLSGSLFNFAAPEFEVNISAVDLHTSWYFLSNDTHTSENYTFLGDGFINQNAWNMFGNGTISIKFYGNNTAGNTASSEITIRKDILAPLITINAPTTNQQFGHGPPSYDLSIIEGNLDTIWYTLNDGYNNSIIYGLTGLINQEIWDTFPNGYITIKFYANDTLGNISFDEVIVVKDIPTPTPPPGGIPGYNVIILLGMISLIAAFIIRREFNKK